MKQEGKSMEKGSLHVAGACQGTADCPKRSKMRLPGYLVERDHRPDVQRDLQKEVRMNSFAMIEGRQRTKAVKGVQR